MKNTGILITDFDGTVTQYDFYDLVCQRFPEIRQYGFWDRYEQGEITHFEAMQGIYGKIRTDEETLFKVLDEMQFDRGLPAAVNQLGMCGWKIMVVSAGSSWYIRRLFARAGLLVEIHANPGEYHPDRGLLLSRPEHSQYYSEEYGIDKSAVVQNALKQKRKVAYAGDGRTDLAPIVLVEPKYRFANGWLASRLKGMGETYHSFEKWSQIADTIIQVESN